MLGRHIGRLVGTGRQSVGRGDVDHPAPSRCTHQRQGRRGGVEGGRQVDRDDRVPFRGREIGDRRDVLDAGIVDQDIAGAGLFDQRAAVVALGHVGPDVADLDPVFAGHAFGQRVILVRVAEAVQDHVRAGARQPVGHAQPDARVGSGDDGGLALEEFLEHRLLLDGPERRFAGAAWAKKNARTRRAQVMRQVSYRQETYRAVPYLYARNRASPTAILPPWLTPPGQAC